MKKSIIRACALLTSLVLVTSATAGCAKKSQPNETKEAPKQSTSKKFPTKPIQVIVPQAPGGGSDLTVRAVSKVAEKVFGQSMVVVNRPGGASTVGVDEAVHAKPDGYTLVYPPAGALVVQPHYGALNYTIKDLEPLAFVSEEPSLLVVKKGKYKDLNDFVKAAQAKPGSIKHGVSSAGGIVHLVMEQLFYLAKADAKAIGFKGTAEVKTAILGGHIDAGILAPQDAKPIIESGDVVALAVASAKRIEALPDVPTFKEQGYDVDFTVWKAFFAPKGLPEDVKQVLVDGFKQILNDPELIKDQKNAGQYIQYGEPKEVADRMEKEFKFYDEVIKQTKIGDKMKSLTGN